MRYVALLVWNILMVAWNAYAIACYYPDRLWRGISALMVVAGVALVIDMMIRRRRLDPEAPRETRKDFLRDLALVRGVQGMEDMCEQWRGRLPEHAKTDTDHRPDELSDRELRRRKALAELSDLRRQLDNRPPVPVTSDRTWMKPGSWARLYAAGELVRLINQFTFIGMTEWAYEGRGGIGCCLETMLDWRFVVPEHGEWWYSYCSTNGLQEGPVLFKDSYTRPGMDGCVRHGCLVPVNFGKGGA